jgi:hypothetical protein
MRAVSRSAGWACALLAVLCAGATAWACSCLPYPDDPREAVQRAWDQSDAVLSGTVSAQRPISAADAPSGIEVTLDVARRWKGPDGTQMKIRTSDSSASCGYSFETGAQYLVFASRDSENGQYSTGLCSLTRPLADARALVRVLDERAEAK